MAEYLKASMHGATFRGVAAVDEPGDSRLNHRSGTHRTGLDSDINSRAIQAVVSDAFGRCAQGYDLCMGAWITSGNAAVTSARQEPILEHDYAPNGHFASFRRGSRFSERQLHVGDVIHRKLAKSLDHSALGTMGMRYSIKILGDFNIARGIIGV
jgi:hypothetical protein